MHYSHQRGEGGLSTEAGKVAERIVAEGPERAFTAADFADIASARNAGNILGRMYARGELARAIRGVYCVPDKSELLGTEVSASVDEVVRAVPRVNKRVVTPAGDAAFNALGLDTQVPARHIYVSSGPYKTYSYGPYTIELRHRANCDLFDRPPVTRIVVQAFKTRGRNGASYEAVSALARNLADEDADTLLEESKGLTSWTAEGAKRIWRERHDG